MNGRLSNIINYRKISEGVKEFRRADYWLIDIVPAKGIYFPGNELLQIRTTTFDLEIDDAPQVESKKIRSYTVKQGMRAESTAGTFSMTLTDRVDQTIAYYFDELRNAIYSKDVYANGLSKEMYIHPEITVTYYDIHENPIRRIRLIDVILAPQNNPSEGGSADPALEEDFQITGEFQHHERLIIPEHL